VLSSEEEPGDEDCEGLRYRFGDGDDVVKAVSGMVGVIV